MEMIRNNRIVYYHLRQFWGETRLSSQNKQYMGSHCSLNHTHRSLTVMLTELWLDVLVKMQIFRMVNYLLL
jgi:hypothetical protein